MFKEEMYREGKATGHRDRMSLRRLINRTRRRECDRLSHTSELAALTN